VNDLCAGQLPVGAVRGRILGWLAEGTREVSWALCSVPRERWTLDPPPPLGARPALRHVRAMLLRDRDVTLPAVRRLVDEEDVTVASLAEFEQAEAAWDPRISAESAAELVRELGEVRFELLQLTEAAPAAAWGDVEWEVGRSGRPARLHELLLGARQHELDHLAAIWRVALYWDRVSPTNARHAREGSVSFPLHPADRFS
jgi:hypothetical protein